MSFSDTHRLNNPFKVYLMPADDPSDETEITEYVTGIEKMVDTVEGDVPTATITVNTRDGILTTTDKDGNDLFDPESNTVTGENPKPPPLDSFQLCRIRMTDNDDHSYERIYYIDEVEPQQTLHGQTTDLHLYAREAFLKHVKFTGHYYFVTAVSVIRDVVGFYNDVKGPDQPEIVASAIDVPGYVSGIYDFGKETNCYDALLRILSTLSLPVSAGGSADYYDMRFTEHDTDPKKIELRIFSMGSRSPAGGQYTEIKRSAYLQHITETRQPITANIVVLEGAPDSGTTPRRVAQFSHAVEIYNTFPLFNPGVDYPTGAYVRRTTFINDTTSPIADDNHPYDPDNQVYRARKPISTGDPHPQPLPPLPDPDANPPVSGSNADWQLVSIEDFANDSTYAAKGIPVAQYTGYSPWTQNEVGTYVNSLSNGGHRTATHDFTPPTRHPQAGDFAVPDGNLIIKDPYAYRNWANFRTPNENQVPSIYRYGNTSGGDLPDGFRILVDSSQTPIGSNSHFLHSDGRTKTDPYGKDYKDAIVQKSGDQWIVIHLPFEEMECAVRHDGQVYWYNRVLADDDSKRPRLYRPDDDGNFKFGTSQVLQWRSMLDTGIWFGNDCFHYPSRVEAVQGLTYPYRRGSQPNFGDHSAIYWEYQWGPYFNPQDFGPFSVLALVPLALTTLLAPVFDSATTRVYCLGSWAVLFEAPFPATNANSKTMGSLFGGTVDSPRQESVLDLNNLTYTPSGNRGWTAHDAEELGPITGISFWMNFKVGLGIPTESDFTPIPAGDLRWAVHMYDSEDNVWRAEFTYRFPAETQLITIPLSAFRIYRARNPISLTPKDYVQNTLTPELKILEIFERRKVKLITMQWQESYDADGRYNPISAERTLWRVLGRGWEREVAYTGLWIDAFAFVHAPYVREVDDVGAGTYPRFKYADNIVQYPSISNVVQLRSAARAELDLATFRKDVFTIRTEGRCDLRAGDHCYIDDEDVIPLDSFDLGWFNPSTGDQYTSIPSIPPPPYLKKDLILNNGKVWRTHTKKVAVRSVTHSVSSSDGPGGYISDITLADRIGF